MLTAELVEVHRRSGELRLAPTDDARRARILALATRFRELAVARVGEPRDAVEEALAEAAADM